MDFVDKKRVIWAVGATIAAAAGLTLGSVALTENADAACPIDSKAFMKTEGQCAIA